MDPNGTQLVMRQGFVVEQDPPFCGPQTQFCPQSTKICILLTPLGAATKTIFCMQTVEPLFGPDGQNPDSSQGPQPTGEQLEHAGAKSCGTTQLPASERTEQNTTNP
ncbi:MAG: hypothetical protein SF069_16395 [Phycisphaerae bacterium]|nr:hypothetical protein [Phycisphaerae bacterium]